MKYILKNKEIELTEEEVNEIVKQNTTPKEEKKVGITIRSRYGGVKFQSTKTTWKEAVEEGKADLYGADLSGADLSGANLRWVNLNGVNLSGADLREADLREADLYEADLRGADLREADLRWVNLSGADLRGANLYEADLRGAEMQNVKFYGKTSSPKTLTKKQLPDFLNALGFKIEE